MVVSQAVPIPVTVVAMPTPSIRSAVVRNERGRTVSRRWPQTSPVGAIASADNGGKRQEHQKSNGNCARLPAAFGKGCFFWARQGASVSGCTVHCLLISLSYRGPAAEMQKAPYDVQRLFSSNPTISGRGAVVKADTVDHFACRLAILGNFGERQVIRFQRSPSFDPVGHGNARCRRIFEVGFRIDFLSLMRGQ